MNQPERSTGEASTVSTDQVAQQSDFSTKVAGALGWSFLNSVVARVAQLGLGILLARIVAPEEFGIYAVALVVINIALSVGELGVSVALVRHEGDPAEIAPTVQTLALIWSGLLAGVTALSAPYLAAALGAPQATNIVRLMAVAVLASGLAAVPGAMLQRDFRQDQRFVAETVAFGASTVVVVVLAFNDYGPWALAWSRIVANLTAAALMTWFTPRRFWPGFDRTVARQVLAFSLPLAGASLLVFGVLNVDYIVIGAILGPLELGLYTLAFNLSSWPVTAFSSTIRSVSIAGFSELRTDVGRFRSGFARSLSLLMTLTIPACVLLAAFAFPLVRFVYGGRWEPAANALVVLAALGTARVALELAYDVLAALGRSRVILAVNGLWFVSLTALLVWFTNRDGLRGAAWAHVVTIAVFVGPCFIIALAGAGLPPGLWLRGLVRPISGGVAMLVVAVAVTQLWDGDFTVLAIGSVLSFGAYLAVVLPGEREALSRWRMLRRQRTSTSTQ